MQCEFESWSFQELSSSVAGRNIAPPNFQFRVSSHCLGKYFHVSLSKQKAFTTTPSILKVNESYKIFLNFETSYRKGQNIRLRHLPPR